MGIALSIHAPERVQRYIWVIVLVLVAVIVLVQHGAVISFSFGDRH
ncbi:hypothetical protein [Streptosporangium subroseum]|nr:hypothetical protein OHB15_03430 [Streptosporangium subroseum]